MMAVALARFAARRRLPAWGRRGLRAASAGALISALLASTPALAHPHVWITERTQVRFDGQGRIEALVHDWVFDEQYSSYATQGLTIYKSQFHRARRVLGIWIHI